MRFDYEWCLKSYYFYDIFFENNTHILTMSNIALQKSSHKINASTAILDFDKLPEFSVSTLYPSQAIEVEP